ncbi:glycoside hydrolase family 12 protein [Xylaria nigripes]|nr:glycoside hydrolase family 12 protein [Xylaria nigripes]
MRTQFWILVALSPLLTHALPKNAPRDPKCGCGNPSTTAPITTGLPLSEIPSFTFVPAKSLPTRTYTTYSLKETSTTAVSIGLPLTDFPTFPVVPIESLPSAVYTTFRLTTKKATATATATAAVAATPSPVSSPIGGLFHEGKPVPYSVNATTQCGDDDRLILPGMPWTVANSMYNANQMVGQQCTNFDAIFETTEGGKEVEWTSVTDISFVDETKDVCKGYSNIGIGVNLNHKLGEITSIPAHFKWNHTNSTTFRGANLFDFIVSPMSGDTISAASSEFMLWIRNWDQVPVGHDSGPVATFDLFGAHWSLYEGSSPVTRVKVRSMLPDKNYDGEFRGDLKQWLDAMVEKKYISSDDYVTVGNAGTEVFYGKATMQARVGLDIEV